MSEAPQQVDLDLDADRPTTFRLQGQVFTLKQLSYRAFAAADKAFVDAVNTLDEEAEADEAELQAKIVAAGEAGEEVASEDLDIADSRRNARWSRQLDAFADFVRANIVEVEAFNSLHERDERGVQQRDMHTLRRWLWEAQIGRPLASREGSSPGPSSSDPSSRDESGSAAVIRPS